MAKEIDKPILCFDRQLALLEAEDLEQEPLLKQTFSFDDLYRDLAFACAKQGREKMLELIVKRRPALVNAKNPVNGNSLLQQATLNWANVSFLLEQGADPAFKNEQGYTSLHLAAYKGIAKVVEKLLEYGANIEERTEEIKNTPLMLAVRGRATEVMRLLLAHGADVNAANGEEWTALHLASAKGNIKACKELIAHQANLNAKAKSLTPLMLAVFNRQAAVVELLIESGAQPDETVLRLACSIDDPAILTYLQS